MDLSEETSIAQYTRPYQSTSWIMMRTGENYHQMLQASISCLGSETNYSLGDLVFDSIIKVLWYFYLYMYYTCFFFYRFNYIFVQHYHFWLFWLRLGKSYIEICFSSLYMWKNWQIQQQYLVSIRNHVFHGFTCMFKIFRSWTRANSASELLQRIRCHLQKNCLSKVRGFLAGQGFQFLPLIVSNILIH